MTSLLDPKVDEEPGEEASNEWYAVMLYDDGSGVWHLSRHPTEEEALIKLRELTLECVDDHDEEEMDDDELDDWHNRFDHYEEWTLSDMNAQMSADGNNTVFCVDGSKCCR